MREGKGKKSANGAPKRKKKKKKKKSDGKKSGGKSSQGARGRVPLRHRNALDAPGSILDALDDFSLMHIFSFLDAPSLCRVARVCKHFALLAGEEEVWEGVRARTPGMDGAAEEPPEGAPVERQPSARAHVRAHYVRVRSECLRAMLSVASTQPVDARALGWLQWDARCCGRTAAGKRVRGVAVPLHTRWVRDACVVHTGVPLASRRPLVSVEELMLRGVYEDVTWTRNVLSSASVATLCEHRGVQLRHSVVNDSVHTLMVTRGDDVVESVLLVQSLRRVARHAWWKAGEFDITVTLHDGARVLCVVRERVQPGNSARIEVVSASSWGKKPRVRGALALPWRGVAFGGEMPHVLLVSVQVCVRRGGAVAVSMDGPLLFTPRAGSGESEWDGAMRDGRVGMVDCRVVAGEHKGKPALFLHSLEIAV